MTPWPAWFREISKEEAEWVWDLLSRRNWISGKTEVGMRRRQVKEQSRMAHRRQGTDEKLVTRIKASCGGPQEKVAEMS